MKPRRTVIVSTPILKLVTATLTIEVSWKHHIKLCTFICPLQTYLSGKAIDEVDK